MSLYNIIRTRLHVRIGAVSAKGLTTSFADLSQNFSSPLIRFITLSLVVLTADLLLIIALFI